MRKGMGGWRGLLEGEKKEKRVTVGGRRGKIGGRGVWVPRGQGSPRGPLGHEWGKGGEGGECPMR